MFSFFQSFFLSLCLSLSLSLLAAPSVFDLFLSIHDLFQFVLTFGVFCERPQATAPRRQPGQAPNAMPPISWSQVRLHAGGAWVRSAVWVIISEIGDHVVLIPRVFQELTWKIVIFSGEFSRCGVFGIGSRQEVTSPDKVVPFRVQFFGPDVDQNNLRDSFDCRIGRPFGYISTPVQLQRKSVGHHVVGIIASSPFLHAALHPGGTNSSRSDRGRRLELQIDA